jgi:DNA repair protein RAD5
MIKLKAGDVVKFERSKPAKVDPDVKKKATKKDNILVRFRNPKGFEVGRLAEADAAWVAKLLDLDMANITGRVVDCPAALYTGCDVMLSVRVDIHDSAFQSIEPEVHHSATPEPAKKRPRLDSDDSSSSGKNKDAKGKAKAATGKNKDKAGAAKPKAGFYAELKENEQEKRLRERKVSLNRLFSAVNLRPIASSSLLKSHKDKDRTETRDILEHFDGPAERAVKDKDKDAKGKGKAKAELVDEEDGMEGEELDKKVVSAVYAKATMNDLRLPCVPSFSLLTLLIMSAASWTRPSRSNYRCGHTRSRRCSAWSAPLHRRKRRSRTVG